MGRRLNLLIFLVLLNIASSVLQNADLREYYYNLPTEAPGPKIDATAYIASKNYASCCENLNNDIMIRNGEQLFCKSDTRMYQPRNVENDSNKLCTTKEITKASNKYRNSCVGYAEVGNKIIFAAVVCDKKKTIKVTSCCKKNQIYNANAGICVKQESVSSTILPSLKSYEILLDYRKSFTCEHSRNEYIVSMEKFTPNEAVILPNDQYNFLVSDYICLSPTEAQDKLLLRKCLRESYCDSEICINKCCPDATVFNEKFGRCVKIKDISETINMRTAIENMDPYYTQEFISEGFLYDYGLQNGINCYQSIQKESRNWRFNQLGQIVVEKDNNTSVVTTNHCIEQIYNKQRHSIDVAAFTCAPTKKTYYVSVGVLILSAISLFITIIVYSMVPELRNVYLACLCFLLVTKIIAAIFLVVDELRLVTGESCRVTTYISAFITQSNIAWLNIMFYNVLAEARQMTSQNTAFYQSSGLNKFTLYLYYALGCPLLCIIGVIVIEQLEVLTISYSPHIFPQFCWYFGNIADFIFYLPIVFVQLLANFVYIHAIHKHYKGLLYGVQTKVSRTELYDCSEMLMENKNQFFMNKILLAILGLSWTIITSVKIAHRFTLVPVWLVELTMIFSAADGFIIFTVFVLKPSIFSFLNSRFNITSQSNSNTMPWYLHYETMKEELSLNAYSYQSYQTNM